MLKILSVVMVQFLLVGLQVYAQSGKPGRDARGNDPAGLTSNVTAAQAESRIIQPSLHQHLDVDVDVVSGPKKDDWDRISLGINFFLALVGAAGVVSAVITLLIIRKQVDEMRGQSATMSTTLATIKKPSSRNGETDYCLGRRGLLPPFLTHKP